jgi:nitrogen-specific signal transduction histidine kinase
MASDYFELQDVTALYTLLHDTMSKPGEVRTRELHVAAGGEWRTLVAHAAALHDDPGSGAPGVVISLRDVTQERQMRQRLIASERMVGTGQMMDGFAHELNNVLQAIVLTCELLRDTQPSEPVRSHVQVIDTQTHRARELVQNLIVCANPANQVRAVIDLGDLIQRTLRLRRYSLSVRHLSVSIAGDGAVPRLMGNPTELMQVFLNMLVNAEARGAAIHPRRAPSNRPAQPGKGLAATFASALNRVAIRCAVPFRTTAPALARNVPLAFSSHSSPAKNRYIAQGWG